MADVDPTRASGSRPGSPVETLRAVLTIQKRMGKDVEGEGITILFGAQMLVGRDKSCDICIDDDRVSRKHALIKIDRGAATLADLGSTNGTARNGEELHEEIILQSGDHVSVGRARTFEIRITSRERAITSVRLASGAEAYLLAPQEILIGFADPKNRNLDLKIYDPSILPRHARIDYFTGQTFIVSHDPAQPVVVNSRPVREIEIRNNYLIEIGQTLILFERA